MILKFQKRYVDGSTRWHIFGDVTELHYTDSPFVLEDWRTYVHDDDPEIEDPETLVLDSVCNGAVFTGKKPHMKQMALHAYFKSDGQEKNVVFSEMAFLCNDRGDTIESIPNHPGTFKRHGAQPESRAE